jgi:hypothetical protein
MTVDCPLDCEFLREARKHDPVLPVDEDSIPNPDIQLSRKELEANEDLLIFLIRTLVSSALTTPGAVDFDAREALDCLIRTYRTLQSGVYYDSVPQNKIAANIYRQIQQGLKQFREEESQRIGISKTRDAHVLVLLVYLQRIELDRNNGRGKGRAFLGALKEYYGVPEPEAVSGSSLILP